MADCWLLNWFERECVLSALCMPFWYEGNLEDFVMDNLEGLS